ncbi:molybdenum cofactor biosysynthesis protein [Nostoc linckia z18]|uniref:Molybdenum cofactor biosysynthesis protein n=2 Tax=Nostoc linckia TaxID=92942 RepID=A0A9Q5Z4E6_NOSLI|nr:MOSC domain-containing protein [Nostoc linckia]PHK27458.1 molybdenum cofactor biosysynthesis protein [Nostoc linckia z15]PHK38242.1 molybdenum cofactor biosysynthesis protein [Nostoc linckia z16]PHJ52898.1 molybdenum cofactor biosysynthesis protein [Nostoc linckia z1]PHJ56118.1 molybdenum cofactor biosysynthesis protein [Nostoc linckia z3]PHJ56389.1 molybdenum cofactor biosysynthesis protein [Nostoc linckia z2]
MKLISVCVGLPREVSWKRKSVTTGIFKQPVNERVMLRTLNLDGDGQADLTVHGGVEKAVYAYPMEHYAYWRQELPDEDLPWGAFGENLTIEGLSEREVNIGDRFRIGSAVVMVTQPRFPCFKLNLKFGRDDMVKRFLNSRLSGIYFSVVQEGEIGVGDEIELVSRDENNVTVADIVQIYVREADDDLVRRAVRVPALAEGLRTYFQQQIEPEH